jgi:hypothetical protein
MKDPKTKAIGLAYVLSQLLLDNLEIARLEMQYDPEYGQINDKLMKLRGATRNAFRSLEKNVGEDLSELKNEIEETLDELWGY